MTDDIVARLRGPYEWRSIAVKYGCDIYDETPLDAADEIERLREEIQELKKNSTIFILERSDAICKNADLREEIERMRAALLCISRASQPHRDAPTYTVQHLQGTIDAMQAIASAALEGEHIADAGKKVVHNDAAT